MKIILESIIYCKTEQQKTKWYIHVEIICSQSKKFLCHQTHCKKSIEITNRQFV